MRITVLRRGGLAVYGGSYDARRDVAIADTANDQTVKLVFPDTITALTITNSGLSNGSITISGKTATFTVSGAGCLTAVATMGNERPSVTIEAETYGRCDYGDTV